MWVWGGCLTAMGEQREVLFPRLQIGSQFAMMIHQCTIARLLEDSTHTSVVISSSS